MLTKLGRTVFYLVPVTMLVMLGAGGCLAAEPAKPEAAAKVLDLRTFPRLKGSAGAGIETLGILLYEAPAEAKAAYEFQKQALTKAGWKEQPGGYHAGTNHSAQFKKGDFTLSVGVSAASGDPQKEGWSQVSLVNHGNVAATSLPVPKGMKPFGNYGGEASYLTGAKVADTAEAARKLLTGAGWVPYGTAGNDEMPMLYFKKNGIRVMAWISTAPAQGNQTLLRYSTDLLSADLPFPPDAPDPRYDDSDKSVSFDYPGDDIMPVVKFYQTELARLGWKPTTDHPITDDRDKTAFLIFRNDAGDLVSLDMKHFTDIVRTKVEFDTAAEVKEEERLAKEAAKKKLAEDKLADEKLAEDRAAELAEKKRPSAKPPGIEMPDFGDDTDINSLLKSAEKMAADAIGEAQDAVNDANGKKKPATAPAATAKGSTSVADLALPEGAGVEYSKITKMIKVQSADDVATLARFFQERLPEQGWLAEPNPLVTDDTAILKFTQGEASLTIMADGEDAGSEATLMAKGMNWDRTPASRAATKVASKRPSQDDDEAPAEMPEEPSGDEPAEPKPAKLRYAANIPAAQQKVRGATMIASGKTYQLAYGVAYQAIDDGGDQKTEVLLSTKPINVAKVVALLNNGQDGGDALSFDPQLKLRYDAEGKLSYLFMYAGGLSVNLGGQGEDKIQASLEINGERASGQAKLVEPGKLFDNEYTFTAPFDVPLIVGKPAGTAGDDAPAPATEELGAEDHDGIPYPLVTKNRSSSGSQFRKTAEATIPAPLATVVEFYRRELAARGWKEDAKAAKVTEGGATLAFASPEGTIGVTLAANGEDTQATLAVRYPAKAKAAGIEPQPNKGRLILGNAGDKEVTIVINGQPYKVAAGKGAQNPKDGVSLHVLPGNYTFSVKAGGKEEPGEKLKIAVGETWGIIVLPTGGYFADQVY